MAAREIEESLSASYWEGVAAQITGNVVGYYLIPLALLLGAGTGMVGWIVAVPSLVGALAQFFVADVLRAVANRRRLLLIGAALQGLLLLPVCALPFAAHAGRLWALLAAVAAYQVVGGFMNPVWGSLMSEYLPANERGAYFGSRSRILGLSGIVLLLVFGVGLRQLKSGEGLALVFAVGAAARLVSVRWMARMVDLPEARRERVVSRLDVAALLERLRRSNFARFAAYTAWVTFASQLATVYFAVHMLQNLRFGYLEYSMVRLAAALGGFLSYSAWGRRADRVGNVRVLRLAGLLAPLAPLLWVPFDSVLPLFLVELLGGAARAGFSLCSTNFVYEAVPANDRVRALGLFNMANGIALFAGALGGGWLAVHLPAFHGSPMRTLFLLAAGVRLSAEVLLTKGIDEVRPLEAYSSAGGGIGAAASASPASGMRPMRA